MKNGTLEQLLRDGRVGGALLALSERDQKDILSFYEFQVWNIQDMLP